jgi:hypothetical protein
VTATIRFRATIEAAGRGGHVVEVDAERAAAIGAGHRSRVRGRLDGADYRSNLVRMDGRIMLGVHRATLTAAGADTGDEVAVTMRLDDAPLPNDAPPPELTAALASSPAGREAWDRLAPSHRRAYVGYVTEAKRPETRARRAAASVERMIAGATRP